MLPQAEDFSSQAYGSMKATHSCPVGIEKVKFATFLYLPHTLSLVRHRATFPKPMWPLQTHVQFNNGIFRVHMSI